MENSRQLSIDFTLTKPTEVLNDCPNILLSLRKKYFDQIITGEKKFEYRRSFKKEATNAYVYLTSPDSVIPGYLKLGEPIVGSPQEISRIAEAQRVGHGSIVFDYLDGAHEAFAIPITELCVFKEPVTLTQAKEVNPSISAPQSYIILDTRRELLSYLQNKEFYSIKIQHGSS